MTNGKLNKKYAPIIWIVLLLACFMRNAYMIYLDVINAEIDGIAGVLFMALRFVLGYGAVPMAIVFLCAFVVWQIGSMRYVRCISRNDFCYLVMATVAGVKLFVGIIEIFAILNPDIASVTSTVLEFTLLTGAMLALYFLVIVRWYKFNPVEKYNAFKLWSIVYMVVAGITVLSQNISILSLAEGSALSLLFWQIYASLGGNITLNMVQIGASIAAMCIYFAYLIAVIVLGEVLRHRANKFRNPETRAELYEGFDNRSYTLRSDAESVFGGMDNTTNNDEHVFDEFDL